MTNHISVQGASTDAVRPVDAYVAPAGEGDTRAPAVVFDRAVLVSGLVEVAGEIHGGPVTGRHSWKRTDVVQRHLSVSHPSVVPVEHPVFGAFVVEHHRDAVGDEVGELVG